MPDLSTSILGPDNSVSILMPEIEFMTEPKDPPCEDLTSAVNEDDLGLPTTLAEFFVLTANVLERVTMLGLRLGVSPGDEVAVLTGGTGRLDLRSKGCLGCGASVESP